MKGFSADPLAFLVRGLTVLTSVSLTLSGQVNLVAGLMVPVAVFVGWRLRRRGWSPGSGFEVVFHLLAALAFLYFLYMALGRLRLLEASTTLLFLGQAYFAMRPAGRREVARLQSLAFFQMLALTAATTNVLFLFPFLVYLVLAPLALTLSLLEGSEGEERAPAPVGRGLLRASAGASALALACGALLFPLVPRYEAGLLSQLRREERETALSGFSERVRFGDINGIKESSRLVFRARVEGLTPEEIRWRGIALDRYDGRSWSLSLVDKFPVGRGTRSGGEALFLLRHDRSEERGPRASIQLEPLSTRILFHLQDSSRLVSGDLGRLERDDWWNLYSGAERRERNTYAIEVREAAEVAPLGETERRRMLALPTLDARIEALAGELATNIEDPAVLARRIEAYLSTRLDYTLDVDDRGLDDPLAVFLFERRSGHCEYFASAMTVLLRVNGVPARLVNGFQPGNYSNLTGTWSVRMRDAHSWVEAWIPGRGWVAYDPTPAVAASGRLGPLAWARDLLDFAVTYWDDNVIGYNVYFQINALLNLRDGLKVAADRLREHAGLAWTVLGGAALLAGALWARWRMASARRARARSRVAWMERILRRLEGRGWPRGPGQTVREWAEALAAEAGDSARPLVELVRIYYAERFGGRKAEPARVEALGRALEELPSRRARR